MRNVIDIFPWLCIRSKLLIAFVRLSIIPLILVDLYGIHSNAGTMKKIALEDLPHDMHTVRERAGNVLAKIQSDLLVVRQSSLLEQFAHLRESLDRADRDSLLARMATALRASARTKGIYFQIRIVDRERDELLRIQCDDIADSAKHYRSVPQQELRRRGESDYFLLAQRPGAGRIGFSPGELRYQGDKRIPVVGFVMAQYGLLS